MAVTPMLAGLFDRPINTVQRAAIDALDSGYTCNSLVDPDCTVNSFTEVCDPGYSMDVNGFCVPIPGYDGGGSPTGSTGSSTTTTIAPSNVDVIVNNTTNVSDNSINALTQAVNQGILDAANNVNGVVQSAENGITSEIQEAADEISNGIGAAQTNLGNEVTVTTTALAASTAATVATIGASTNNLLTSVQNAITPILTTIAGIINSINTEVQAINDTLIQPIVSLYNSTIGTIATLTTAIESDLKNGISGLLAIPGQLADQLGSFDASLNRTVQQLGTINSETVTSGIDYATTTLPQPFGEAFAKSLGGTTLADTIKTTFTAAIPLTNETLQSVSNEAISGLGTLLNEILHIVTSTFSATTNQLHADWSSVESVFTGLLDGVLGLLTTLTSMAALASPLIDIAQQQARTLVPTTKLDPAAVIEAMNRELITADLAASELATYGYDQTRIQTLTDLSIYLADVNTALDWWYRGIIADTDLAANMNAHNIQPADQTALKAGSTYLPSVGEFVRWLNFGIITQDQFIANLQVLRYDPAQVQAVLQTYQDQPDPNLLAKLDGLLNASKIGWFNQASVTPPSDAYNTAAQRANWSPALAQYMWQGHWDLLTPQQFLHNYFRGVRTLTELQARLEMSNIPQALWDDFIEAERPVIPLFILGGLLKSGGISVIDGQAELARMGYDLSHQEMIIKAYVPASAGGGATTPTAVKTLSISNARELWGMQGITDAQYTAVLEAHGYTPDTAKLQLQADAVTEHIKQQKQILTDLTAEVEAGTLTMDQATSQLTAGGFSQGQISKFALAITKSQRVSSKIPSIAELDKFLKDGLITLAQYNTALVALGWQDPWLTAYMTLAADNVPQPSSGG